MVDKRRDASVKMTKENAEKVNLAYKVKTAKERFIYAISNISENIHSFSMENDGKSYEILSFIKNENSNIFDFEEVEDFLRESIQYIGA